MNRVPTAGIKTAFKKVTHVIFDLDGLLLDTEGIYKQVITNIAKEHGKIYTNATRLKVLGRPDHDGARICVSDMKLPMTNEQFLQEFRNRSSKLLTSCPFMPGAERFVKHLHKNQVPIAVATSSTKDSMKLKTAKYSDVFSLFHHIVSGGTDPEVKHGKPSPDIFLVCASRFPDKPCPAQCLVFEDAPNGVTAANKAGMQCVMVPDPHIVDEQKQQATLVLKSLEEMKPETFGLPPLNGL